jgi:hypothetical protein
MFCKKERKLTQVPYIQLFFFLSYHPEWLNKCRLDTQTMVTLCKNPPNCSSQKTHLMLHQLPLSPLPSHLTRLCPTGLYPLQLIPGGDRAPVPFRASELKAIKKDLRNYTENPGQYIQAFREVSKTLN